MIYRPCIFAQRSIIMETLPSLKDIHFPNPFGGNPLRYQMKNATDSSQINLDYLTLRVCKVTATQSWTLYVFLFRSHRGHPRIAWVPMEASNDHIEGITCRSSCSIIPIDLFIGSY